MGGFGHFEVGKFQQVCKGLIEDKKSLRMVVRKVFSNRFLLSKSAYFKIYG
jgi:hypothetical protein